MPSQDEDSKETIKSTTKTTATKETAQSKTKNNKDGNHPLKNTKNTKKKRKRFDPEEQLEQERLERYEKLVYQAKKAIHKEAKIVKSFECQKVVRKIKEVSIPQQQAKNKQQQQQQVRLLQEKLQTWKSLSLDSVVHVCLLRLGLPNLNPKLQYNNNDDNNNDDDHKESVSMLLEMPKISDSEMGLVEKVLQHSRFTSSVMEVWNDKVTEYRRWYLKRRDVVTGVPDFVQQYELPNAKQQQQQQQQQKKKKKTKKNQAGSKNDNNHTDAMVNHLFVNLSGGDDNAADANYDDDDDDGQGAYDEYDDVEQDFHYGPATGLVMTQKKNRPGQRQRKAKALAMEAKKKGRTISQSFNIREKKERNDNDENQEGISKQQESKDVRPKQVEASKIAEMGKTWKEDGQAHPSWAARTSVKTGIVAFTGKKITFD